MTDRFCVNCKTRTMELDHKRQKQLTGKTEHLPDSISSNYRTANREEEMQRIFILRSKGQNERKRHK